MHQRVLELRLGGAQAAVKKIDALLARAGDDDRVRGAFRYHGAATGRWAGEGFQPQNLKRPVVGDLDAAIAAVSTGDYGSPKGTIKVPTILSVALSSTLADLGSVGEGIFHALPDMARNFDTISARP